MLTHVCVYDIFADRKASTPRSGFCPAAVAGKYVLPRQHETQRARMGHVHGLMYQIRSARLAECCALGRNMAPNIVVGYSILASVKGF